MANKYANNIIFTPVKQDPFSTFTDFAGKTVGGAKFSMWWYVITKPFVMEEPPHTHSHDQIVLHMGGDPLNMKEFDAVFEMGIGPENEIHIIDKPAVLYIPAGLVHRGAVVKSVSKPVIVVNIFLVDEYAKLKTYDPVTGKEVPPPPPPPPPKVV